MEKFGQWLTEQENPPAYTFLQDDIKNIQQDVTRASYNRIINNKEYYSLLMNVNEFPLILNGPMMEFWQWYLDTVDLLLCFVRATCEEDWKLHLTCIQNMIPWFHAYDYYNYARYASLYWCQMKHLPESHPEAYIKMLQGGFVVQRSCRGFTQTVVDQTLEQILSKEKKSKSGIIRFSLNKGAIQRWVLAAHERAAMCCNLKKMVKFQKSPETVHKEATSKRTDQDERDVRKIINVTEGWRNPFESSDDLVCLSSGSIATKEVSDALLGALETGTTVAEKFIKKRIIDKSVDFYDSLSKNNLNTFKSMAAATKVKVNRQLEILKADRSLFARYLAVIGQTRSMDMHQVLSHCLGPVHWSLATTDGTLAKTQKSKLAEALEKEVPPEDKDPESVVWVFDAMAVVQAPVQISDIFGELALPLLNNQMTGKGCFKN